MKSPQLDSLKYFDSNIHILKIQIYGIATMAYEVLGVITSDLRQVLSLKGLSLWKEHLPPAGIKKYKPSRAESFFDWQQNSALEV